MKIGILQTGHGTPEMISAQGDIDRMFMKLLGARGFDFETFAVVDGIFPDTVEDADGWLITGSKHGAYEDHDWIPPLEEFIRAVHADGRPMIGVCFGHQIIAQAMGGKVEKFSGGWSVGHKSYEIEGETHHLNAWHQDQVTEVPEGARVIGHNDFCANAALIYDDRILTIQPHPEFNAEVIDLLIRTRGPGVVPEELLQSATAQLDKKTDSDRFADRMEQFFKRGA
ncbi:MULTISPECIES: type 1 glutamine amidotransferase [Roseovarius]|uniref:Glutamine amidotransferase, class I n=1 Tax=Roseovarius nubinhibens (strain ATCC BAA-591 / DSM 15170 / ISM) TaxID=89187 RepID=A3SH83_ROSNI|nr:type 1 glutamine amidotransferase [Roseovarius nubinhibens]EAP76714.1 glutamine amidotransferase, class I [Roseovarius nubinhibens ISM]